MKRIALGLLAVLAAAFAAVQLVPVDRENPPVEETVDAPPEVLALLRRSCFDCHSHETRWPWYSYVAPVSWRVADDVRHAREHVNFSTWNRYPPDEREDLLEEVADEVGDGSMPLPLYLLGHPGARPSDAERARIVAWANAAAGDAERVEEAEEEAEDDGSGRGRGRGRGRGHDHDDHEH